MTWMIQTTDREDKALFDLSEKKDLPPEKIFIQALRLYQAWVEGHVLMIDSNSSLGCGAFDD